MTGGKLYFILPTKLDGGKGCINIFAQIWGSFFFFFYQ
jgi:hypothetical protein